MTPDPHAAALTPERLDELDRLCDAATPGPWHAHNPDDAVFMNVYLVSDSQREPGMGDVGDVEYGKVIALTLFQYPRVVDHESQKWEANAEFIAACHPSTVRSLVAGCRAGIEARAGYHALDRNWHAVHEGAMTQIREAVGNPDATVPEIVEHVKRLAGEVERLTVAERQWQTTYGDLEHVVHSIKEILGGPADEGCVWSAQRVVEERDRLRAALAEAKAEVNELKSRKTATILPPVTRPSFVIEDEE